MDIKEVLVIEPNGNVLTEAAYDSLVRHDILVGKIIKKYYDKAYKIKDSMLDNSKYACELFGDLVIMPDISDLVALFPKEISKEQASYYLDVFGDERVRIHAMQYIGNGRYRDLNQLIEVLKSIVQNDLKL